MNQSFHDRIATSLSRIEADGLFKRQRPIASAQGPHIDMAGCTVLNLCANNYPGLANDPRLADAARNAIGAHGYGMASVRFVCGTHPHADVCHVRQG